MGKLVSFGEIMLRLEAPNNLRISQTHSYDAVFGGDEANVAVSAANYGMDAEFVTRLPKNPIADACVAELRGLSVGVDNIARGGERMGIYFVEHGASQRASVVIYDRAHSSISEASRSDFDWGRIFDGATRFHFTGITPALSDSAAEVTLDAAKTAHEMGLIVSCDLNYRKKLWSTDKAERVMTALMPYVDILIANEEDADKVFGIRADDTDVNSGVVSGEGYRDVCRKLTDRFGFDAVAVTLRESINASVNNFSGALYRGGEFYTSKKYTIHIVDRVGGGDSFAGGLIYALDAGMENQNALEFAVAASVLKHSIVGDFNRVTRDEVLALAGGDGSGRVSR
ncbi:MAG: sugar kinase [Firmicutes bacterium]|nr:sugar kinase [Bacillota bacterium]